MAVQDYCNNTEQMVYAARFSALALAIFALSLFHAYEPLQAATATFHCVNTASGTAWDINVDYDRATANSFPAEITASRIFWKDTKEGATSIAKPAT